MALNDNHFILPHGSIVGVSVIWRLVWAGTAGMLSHIHYVYSHWLLVLGWPEHLAPSPHGLSTWLGLCRTCQLGSKREHSKQASPNFPATYQASVYIMFAKHPSAKPSHTSQLRVTGVRHYTTA